MKVNEIFNKKKPVLSFEIFPPKHEDAIKEIDGTLSILKSLEPDFVSVTCGAGGSGVYGRTMELAVKMKRDYDIEPLVHLTCLNNSKEDVCRILDEMKANNLENVLALRGDRVPDVEPKKDFIHASDLAAFVRSYGDFSVSGACYPECHPEAEDKFTDLQNLKIKTEAGVEHLVTQLFLDNEAFFTFRDNMKIAGIDRPVSAGIMPVVKKTQCEKMVTMCGATLPVKFKQILDRYGDNQEALMDAGIAYAINQIVELLANGADGIHVYTMNNPVVASRICEGIKRIIR